jgi:mycothiol synthase
VNVRPLTRDDLDAVAALARAEHESLFGTSSRIGANDVLAWLQDSELETDSWLFDEGRAPIAAGGVGIRGGRGVQWGIVASRAQGRGLGSRLITLAETRTRARSGQRVIAWTLAPDARAKALFESRGYTEVRRFWEMAIDVREPPAVPELPGGLELATFNEADARAFHDALDEAFRDHWEHHSRPFDEWWEQKRQASDYDPTTWFLVRDGDEIAAVVRNDPDRNGGAEIGALGVRRPWRGKGLGRALLLRSFAEFHRRGTTRIGLGVDAANPTGATKLYESVGMHVEAEYVLYQRELAA